MKKFKFKTNVREILADTVTPVSVYLKMRDIYPNALLLESSDHHSLENSYSFICLKPEASIEVAHFETPTETYPINRVIEPSKPDEYLKRLLRPCLYTMIRTKNPSHIVRREAAVNLLTIGRSPEEIFDLFRRLNWADWNPETTAYQISTCLNLHHASCSLLRKNGIPTRCCIS